MYNRFSGSLIPGSSAVEQATVNRLAGGSAKTCPGEPPNILTMEANTLTCGNGSRSFWFGREWFSLIASKKTGLQSIVVRTGFIMGKNHLVFHCF